MKRALEQDVSPLYGIPGPKTFANAIMSGITTGSPEDLLYLSCKFLMITGEPAPAPRQTPGIDF